MNMRRRCCCNPTAGICLPLGIRLEGSETPNGYLDPIYDEVMVGVKAIRIEYAYHLDLTSYTNAVQPHPIVYTKSIDFSGSLTVATLDIPLDDDPLDRAMAGLVAAAFSLSVSVTRSGSGVTCPGTFAESVTYGLAEVAADPEFWGYAGGLSLFDDGAGIGGRQWEMGTLTTVESDLRYQGLAPLGTNAFGTWAIRFETLDTVSAPSCGSSWADHDIQGNVYSSSGFSALTRCWTYPWDRNTVAHDREDITWSGSRRNDIDTIFAAPYFWNGVTTSWEQSYTGYGNWSIGMSAEPDTIVSGYRQPSAFTMTASQTVTPLATCGDIGVSVSSHGPVGEPVIAPLALMEKRPSGLVVPRKASVTKVTKVPADPRLEGMTQEANTPRGCCGRD